MFETTIAGSLPKPAWLAEPGMLWPPWKLSADGSAAASATRPLHFGVPVTARARRSRCCSARPNHR
jgi:hypothetical protein